VFNLTGSVRLYKYSDLGTENARVEAASRLLIRRSKSSFQEQTTSQFVRIHLGRTIMAMK